MISTNVHTHRVRSYELDMYRHANNSAYVNWLEDGREQFLRTKDRAFVWYPDNLGLWFVVAHIGIDYRIAVVEEDEIAITTRLAAIGDKSITFRQIMRRADEVVCRARVVMAFADDERAVPVPDDFKECFAVSEHGDRWTDGEGGERG